MKKVMNNFFLKFIFNARKIYVNFIKIYTFYQKEKKFKKVGKLVTSLYDKNEYVTHIKKIKTGIKSWIHFEKHSQSN